MTAGRAAQWWARLGSPPRRPLLMGFIGSVLLVIGGLGGGGVLVHDPLLSDTPLDFWRYGHGRDLAVTLVYVGLVLVVWAWVLLGREVIARRVGGRVVLSTAAVWLLPMLVSPPLFTRDAYSYLAQGALPLFGFDPYTNGPGVLTGPLPDNVHEFWHNTPTPYGPLFILIAKIIAAMVGNQLIFGVIAMRLVFLGGLVLLVWATPGLCRHLGGRVPVALWIVAANPMMVIHMVGGPHNDLLVVGLIAAGSLLVLNGRYPTGIAVVSLAVAVKVTAGLALPFLVLVWAGRLQGSLPSRIARAAAGGLAVFLPVFALCSLAAGVSLGWLSALNTPSMIVNWLSVPTGAGELVHWLVNLVVTVDKANFVTVGRWLGSAVFVVLACRQWWLARNGGPDAVRRAGIVLVLAAVLSPTTLPWYLSWGFALLAMVPWSPRALQLIVFISVWLVVVAYPDGETALYNWFYVAAGVGGALLAARALLHPDPLRLSAPRRSSGPRDGLASRPSTAES